MNVRLNKEPIQINHWNISANRSIPTVTGKSVGSSFKINIWIEVAYKISDIRSNANSGYQIRIQGSHQGLTFCSVPTSLPSLEIPSPDLL